MSSTELVGVVTDVLSEYGNFMLSALMNYEAMGVTAGLFQLFGYIAYMRIARIEPHPLTWLMFGYGTLILTVLEWESGATNAELMLPVVCTTLGLYVMVKAWRKALKGRTTGTYRGLRRYWPDEFWPEDRAERWSFSTDLAVTLGYLVALLVAYIQAVRADNYTGIAALLASDNFWVFLFLVLSNLTVFSEFLPLLRETWRNPRKEHPLPWLLWTVAYAALGWATYLYHGFWTVLMMYPLLNTVMHGLPGIFALRKPKWAFHTIRDKSRAPEEPAE